MTTPSPMRLHAQKHADALLHDLDVDLSQDPEARAKIVNHIEYALDEWENAEVDRLKQALKHYARRYEQGSCWNWNERIPDSYSGVVHEFDWKGEEQDEPWEIAEKALNERAEP